MLLVASTTAMSTELVGPPEELSVVEIAHRFELQNPVDIENLPDLVDRTERVDQCMVEYIQRQSRSYAKSVQGNLYDLLHNFDRIASKIYGKTPPADGITHQQKVEALAKIQCEAYYVIKQAR